MSNSKDAVRKILDAAQKGRGKVTLQLDLDDGEEAEIEIPGAWLLTEAMKGELRQVGDRAAAVLRRPGHALQLPGLHVRRCRLLFGLHFLSHALFAQHL